MKLSSPNERPAATGGFTRSDAAWRPTLTTAPSDASAAPRWMGRTDTPGLPKRSASFPLPVPPNYAESAHTQ